MFISTAFAQTAAPAAQGPESSLMGMLPLVLMFVVLYFVMIRPQMKRQKEHKAMIEALPRAMTSSPAAACWARWPSWTRTS